MVTCSLSWLVSFEKTRMGGPGKTSLHVSVLYPPRHVCRPPPNVARNNSSYYAKWTGYRLAFLLELTLCLACDPGLASALHSNVQPCIFILNDYSVIKITQIKGDCYFQVDICPISVNPLTS